MTHPSTLPDARPCSDRFRCAGRERNCRAALIRSLVLVCLWGAIVGLAGTCRGQAGAEKPVAAKPAGVRVGYTLILFGCEDAVVKADRLLDEDTPSLPGSLPSSDCFRCGGRESKFLLTQSLPED